MVPVAFRWLGIGLLFHFLGVFVLGRKSGRSAIEKEAERIRKELR